MRPLEPEAASDRHLGGALGVRPGGSIRARLGLLLALTAAVFALLLVGLERSQRRQVQWLFDERVTETRRVLERLVALRAQGARVHADDYSRWDEFVAFVRTRDPEWGRVNLDESLETFDVDAAWVLDARRRLVYTANAAEDPALAALPTPPERLDRHLRGTPHGHFFARVGGGIVEVWHAPIRASDDFTFDRTPAGYYVIARRWTPERIASLAQLASGGVALAPPGAAIHSSAHSGRIEIRQPLPGLDGRPVADLRFETTYPVAPRVRQAFESALLVMLAGLGGLLVLSWLALSRWVREPLATIADALRNADPSRLGATPKRADEMGDVARLVDEFFVQRRALTEAREAAERAAEAKSLFLANISHELRTPMHGILSFSRFGLRDARTAEREELEDNFRQIEDCGSSLLALLNDLLDLAKFEAGRMTMAFGDTSLPDVARDAGDEFASLYAERGVELEFETPDVMPRVVADPVRLQQVMRNLLSNAAKFSPPGGRVNVRIVSLRDVVQVTVADSGRGIPVGELESIFDKFVQATGTHPRSGGTGLGLAICREIVEAHGGRIWAENAPEGGARMVFELPIDGPRAAAGDDAASAGSETRERRAA